MNTTIIVAIVALVSTIVGAVVGAATNYVIARRQVRFAIEQEKRTHTVEVKRAATLIHAELWRACAAATISVETRRWWSRDVPELVTSAWQQHSATIAADLSYRAWQDVTTAIEATHNIKSAREIIAPVGLEPNAISDSIANQLKPMLEDIQQGLSALAPFTLDRPPPLAVPPLQ